MAKMAKDKKIVLTGGTFNRIHPGHEYLLKKCKALGYLVVVLAHDRHNAKKNAAPAETRKKNLEKLGIADEVVVGSPTSFAGVVKRFKPHIIALGYDQNFPDNETEETARKMKIRVVRLRKYGKYSSRRLKRQ